MGHFLFSLVNAVTTGRQWTGVNYQQEIIKWELIKLQKMLEKSREISKKKERIAALGENYHPGLGQLQ